MRLWCSKINTDVLHPRLDTDVSGVQANDRSVKDGFSSHLKTHSSSNSLRLLQDLVFFRHLHRLQTVMCWHHVRDKTFCFTLTKIITLTTGSSPVQPQSSTAGHWNTYGLSTLLKGTLAVATEKEFILLLLDLDPEPSGNKKSSPTYKSLPVMQPNFLKII